MILRYCCYQWCGTDCCDHLVVHDSTFGLSKMVAMWQTFLWQNLHIVVPIPLTFTLMNLIDNNLALVQIMSLCWQGDKSSKCKPMLIHWGRVTHICVSNLTITGSDNGLSAGRRQAIIWTNAGILLIRPLGTNFSVLLIEIDTFSFNKIHMKMSSGKWQPFCLGLNVLTMLA